MSESVTAVKTKCHDLNTMAAEEVDDGDEMDELNDDDRAQFKDLPHPRLSNGSLAGRPDGPVSKGRAFDGTWKFL